MAVSKTPELVFGERLKAIRQRRGWTQAQMAEMCADFGEPIDRSVIAKIEGGKRGVGLNEALTLSAVLVVSPVFMFFPEDPREKVAIGALVRPAAGTARKWVQGHRPLSMEDDLKAWESEVIAEQQPLAAAAEVVKGMVDDLNQYLIPLEFGQLDEAGADELAALITTMKGVLDHQQKAAYRLVKGASQ